MCLDIRLSPEEVKEEVAKLPPIVKVWKELMYGRRGEFTDMVYPKDKIMTARYMPSHKRAIDYKAGFHCFVNKTKPIHSDTTIVRFWVRREWIHDIGERDGEKVYVCSKISPTRKLIK